MLSNLNTSEQSDDGGDHGGHHLEGGDDEDCEDAVFVGRQKQKQRGKKKTNDQIDFYNRDDDKQDSSRKAPAGDVDLWDYNQYDEDNYGRQMNDQPEKAKRGQKGPDARQNASNQEKRRKLRTIRNEEAEESLPDHDDRQEEPKQQYRQKGTNREDNDEDERGPRDGASGARGGRQKQDRKRGAGAEGERRREGQKRRQAVQESDDDDDDVYKRPPQYDRDNDAGIGVSSRGRGQRTQRGGHGQREQKYETGRQGNEDHRDDDARYNAKDRRGAYGRGGRHGHRDADDEQARSDEEEAEDAHVQRRNNKHSKKDGKRRHNDDQDHDQQDVQVQGEEHDEQSTELLEQCAICTEFIVYYAIGPCGHAVCCWNCILRQKTKLENDECPLCREKMTKILITKNKHDSLKENPQNIIYDPETDLYYRTHECKKFVTQRMGLYCQVCQQKGQTRKFPTMDALINHMDQAHHQHYCFLCLEQKAVLQFEQRLYRRDKIAQHKREEHPTCQHCNNKHFYDNDALYRHFREEHYQCDVCKKMGKKLRNKRTGQIEFETFADLADLHKHYRKAHYFCRKAGCEHLAFVDSASLAEHYLIKHNERVPVMIEFKDSDDEDDERNRDDFQQRKKWKRDNVYEQVNEQDLRNQQIQNQQRINNQVNQGYFGLMNVSTLPSQYSNVNVTYSTDLQGVQASDFQENFGQDWVTNNSEYRDYFPTLGGRGRRALRRENVQKKENVQKIENVRKKKTGFEFLEDNAGKNLTPAKFSDSVRDIRKAETMKLVQQFRKSEMIVPKKDRDQMMALNSSTYSPFDQLAFKNQGRSDNLPIQENKGKKGKKKAVGVIVSEQEPRYDLPEYSTADFIEESKREEEVNDGFRVVKKGPRFDDYDSLPQDKPSPPKPSKTKESKKELKQKMRDDELLAWVENVPSQQEFSQQKEQAQKNKKKKKNKDQGPVDNQWNKLQSQLGNSTKPLKIEEKPKEQPKPAKKVQFHEQFNDDDELGEFKFADQVASKADNQPQQPAKFDDSTLIQRGPGKKKKGAGKKGVHFDPYRLPQNVDFTKLF